MIHRNGDIFLKTIIPSRKAKRKYTRRVYEKSRKSFRKKLESEEKDLLSSFEKGEWKTVANVKKRKSRARKVAAKTLRKDVRINIRLSSSDVLNIKQIAVHEGLPYQTLVASILHK